MSSLISATVVAIFMFAVSMDSAHADTMPRPDDTLSFDLSAETWIETKTAQVTVTIEAATPASAAGTVRAGMNKAVADIASADWHLTAFGQTPDQAGMQTWAASYVGRLPENELSGLAESAKKVSRPGLQAHIADVDFTPTLDEVEAGRAALRLKLIQEATAQMDALGKTAGRSYRLEHMSFNDMAVSPTPSRPMMKAMAVNDSAPAGDEPHRANRASMHAQVTLATVPPAEAAAPAH